MGISHCFRQGLANKAFQRLLKNAQVGEHRPKEEDQLVALNQQSGEVFNVPVFDTGLFILDINPLKADVGVLLRECFKTRLIFTACTAPGGAQTNHQKLGRSRWRGLGEGHGAGKIGNRLIIP